VENTNLDCSSTNSNLSIGLEEFLTIKDSIALQDSFRHFYPCKRIYTYSNLSQKAFSRIDRAYHTSSLAPLLDKAQHHTLPRLLSDHDRCISITLKSINSTPFGPGIWKLNSSLLKKKGCHKLIFSIIKSFQEDQHLYPDLHSWWNTLKLALK
jgi:hypothetical protein